MSTKALFPCGGVSNLILGTGTENQIFILRTPAAIKFFHQILKNCHFGVKKNHYPSRWICRRHIKAPVLFPRSIIIFQGVLTKFNFLMKFPHLEIIIDLMKDLKYEHQSTFPLCGRVKLNFRDRYRKPNIYSKNSSHYQVFSSNSQKMTLWCKQNHYPPRWIYIAHIWSHTLFSRGIIIFQGVLTKFHFSTKFPHLEKIVDLMKEYEHQSIFSLWWRVKLNFRDRYRKPSIYSKNSSCYQVFSSNSPKMTLWCKKEIITHPDEFV